MKVKLGWKEVLASDYKHFGHIDNFYKIVVASGYPFFLWNDNVYVVMNEGYKLSGHTIDDIQ